LALDDEVCILGRQASEREQLAQVFAAHLLMPPPLVFSVLDRIGVQEHSVTPTQAYVFAREVGVSYEAGVRHLATLEVIKPLKMQQLLDVRPIDVKTELAHGRRPSDARADVWVIDERWNDVPMALHVHDEVVIALPENRTSGYRWMLLVSSVQKRETDDAEAFADTGPFFRPGAGGGRSQEETVPRSETARERATIDLGPDALLDLVNDLYIPGRPATRTREPSTLPASDILVGATGRRLLTLEAKQPGATELRFAYGSPHDRFGHVEQTFAIRARIEQPRVDASLSQLVGGAHDRP
jgi:predicted secreted protein